MPQSQNRPDAGASPGLPLPPFVPARMLGNGNAQTLWPFIVRRLRAPRRQRPTTEVWPLPDGERLALHLLESPGQRPGVVVVHGLEGSAESPYVRGLLVRLARAGWNAAAFDLRSCGKLASGGSRTAYHAGQTADLSFVVQRLRQRWGAGPLGAVGFSLGGNMLLKWLGELGETSPLRAAVAVSAPYDLAASAAVVDGPGLWSAGYRGYFMRSLRRKALRLARERPADLDVGHIRRCRTFADFDARVTARLFGFASAEDYWARASCGPFLPDIRRPTLLVSAQDDPIVPAHSIPRDAIAANPALTLWLTRGGGHVGFVAGTPWRPVYAAEEAAVDFLTPRFA
jgi:predicted alpha/beta-fold hydrolase